MKILTTVQDLIDELETLPKDGILIGNTVDKEGNWYTYPVSAFKVDGNNNMVAIYLAPLKKDGSI